jgi:DNA-binding beta-propeller fold protein YncE
MQIRRTVALVMSLALVLAACSLLNADPKDEIPHLRFVREFSSAADVKGGTHPILNETLNIIAGPDEPRHTATALEEPYAITTGQNQSVFVTDLSGGVVHVFDFLQQSYFLLKGGDLLRSPMGIAIDADGNVYVSDSELRAVLVYSPNGKFSHYLKKSRGQESYFDPPRGLAVDQASGSVYVCDTPRHMVIVLNKKGDVVNRLGKRGGGNGSGEFKYPTQLAVTGDEIHVLDAGNSRIQVFDKAGRFRRGVALAEPGQHAGFAVDHEGNSYVTDPELNNIQSFDNHGRHLYQFGSAGTEMSHFSGPSGMTVDSHNCLYVVDQNNKRVQVFQIVTPKQETAEANTCSLAPARN